MIAVFPISIAVAIFGLGVYVAIVKASDIAMGVGQWLRDRKRRESNVELPRATWRRP